MTTQCLDFSVESFIFAATIRSLKDLSRVNFNHNRCNRQRGNMALFQTALLLLSIASIAQAYYCGEPPCICQSWSNSVSCFSPHTKQFPVLDSHVKLSTTLVEISNTSMSYLPYFNETEWPNLNILIVEGNLYIDCSYIQAYKKHSPHLEVLSNCVFLAEAQTLSQPQLSTPKCYGYIYYPLITVFLMAFLGLAKYSKEKSKYNKPKLPLQIHSSLTEALQTQTSCQSCS